MAAIIFDGREKAREIEAGLRQKVAKMRRPPRIASVVFEEDEASLLYTKLKKQAAVRVGIEFSEEEVGIGDRVESLAHRVRTFSGSGDIDGVMVQKPAKGVWLEHVKDKGEFADWWRRLVVEIGQGRDVDCLNPVNLARVYTGDWQILPATVAGIVEILRVALPERLDEQSVTGLSLLGVRVAVVGRSEIVGRPLAAVLSQSGAEVELLGRRSDLSLVKEAEIVVSATGKPGLIGGGLIREGAVVVDVGSPKGDVVFDRVVKKARFITPVPGGVGPMTVACLLSNLVEMG